MPTPKRENPISTPTPESEVELHGPTKKPPTKPEMDVSSAAEIVLAAQQQQQFPTMGLKGVWATITNISAVVFLFGFTYAMYTDLQEEKEITRIRQERQEQLFRDEMKENRLAAERQYDRVADKYEKVADKLDLMATENKNLSVELRRLTDQLMQSNKALQKAAESIPGMSTGVRNRAKPGDWWFGPCYNLGDS